LGILHEPVYTFLNQVSPRLDCPKKLQDGKATIDGKEYVSQKGKVYEMVNGMRVRRRNLGGIMDTDLAPKAAALIQFDVNSATISPESFDLLNNYARALQGGLADAKLQIVGHTDNKGRRIPNITLSKRRAAAVREYLSQRGVAAERLKIAGFGPDKPVADNDTYSGRAKNRRVEFIRPLE
jgi:outer membrane protein OmpA-like peptidoglycan-associated protein